MTETDKIREKLVNLARDLILIPGTSTRPEDIERCYEFIKSYIRDIENIEIREYRHNGIPSFFASPKGVDEPEILIISHLDVINHNGPGAYNPVVEDGKIFGAGSGDMKGQVSIMLELFRNLLGKRPDASLGLVITSDEEEGGMSGIGYLFNEVGLRCGVVINPDGGGLNEITVAEKGVIHMHVSCEGHSSHAARPWLGENSIEILSEKLLNLKRYFDSLRKDDTKWYPTCSVTMLSTPNKSINRIPAVAEAYLDIRFTKPYTVEELTAEISTIIGNKVKSDILLSAEPIELEPDYLFKSVVEELTGKQATFVREDGASDARFIHQHGIPVIIARPLVGNLHSDDEWIDIESMITFYKICERFIEKKLGFGV